MDEVMECAFPYTPVYDTETSEKLEKEFSRLNGDYYLDHAGATLYSKTQVDNVSENLKCSLYGNPHSVGVGNGVTHDIIEHTRLRILEHFHTSSEEYSVIFTSGATHSLKIIAESFQFNKGSTDLCKSPGNFVYTQDNHTSVLGMRDVIIGKGANVKCLKHDESFIIMNKSVNSLDTDVEQSSNSLFVYPAQCNFSGLKYPLAWIGKVKSGILSDVTGDRTTKWYTLLDAAAYVSTNDLDLSLTKPDFVCLSFYKMFGYPTGLGTLLVKNTSANVLEKVYYGGGTVNVAMSTQMFHIKRNNLHERFEDGTLPFLSIISLQQGFDILSQINIKKISSHVFSLAKVLHHSLLTLHHSNGKPVIKLYSDTDYEDNYLQGGIVSFNIIRSNGEYVGYMEVINMAALFRIHLRTGCFCNPGSCQRHLSLSNEEVMKNYNAGYVCGGTTDLIEGRPTGAIRASFGYMSNIKDVHALLHMIRKCYLNSPGIIKFPYWWETYRIMVNKKFNKNNTVNDTGNKIMNNNTSVTTNNARNTENSNVITKSFMDIMKVAQPILKGLILTHLFIYPIKSCAAYEVVDSWVMTCRGLQYDREWMIITSTGICLTQKQEVNLCLLKPLVCKSTNLLTLTYPGMPSIQIPLQYSSDKYVEATMCQSRVCGHKVQGIDCGPDVSEWLSLALCRPNLRLIREFDGEREIKDTSKPGISFSSQAQYLLLNKNSILWLTDRVSSNTDFDSATALYRFRGNMIVKGCNPFMELKWKHVRIGKSNFVVNGPCTRCQMICIDQMTGKKTIEPLRTLAEQFHGKLKFGIYLTRKENAETTINIGDAIEYM